MPLLKGFVAPTLEESLNESKEVMYSCTEALLEKTGVHPAEVGCANALHDFTGAHAEDNQIYPDMTSKKLEGTSKTDCYINLKFTP